MRIEDQIDIEKLDWEYIWQKGYQKNRKKGKDWNTVSKDFGKWLENDDYPDVLIGHMNITKNDTVLDLGAAEGTISFKIAKLAKSVTALDRAEQMISEINEKAENQKIDNVETIEMDINDISTENIGNFDIVLASRSFNGIYDMKERLACLNEIANKYVYITLFGSSSHKYKAEKAKIVNQEFKPGPDYIIVAHILKSLGIEPNIIQLDCKNLKEYHSLEEAIQRAAWKLGNLNDEEKENLKNYFKEIFIKNERGNWVNPKDKTDWVLIWWKKEQIKNSNQNHEKYKN